MNVILPAIIGIVTALVMTVFYGLEARDKEYRRKNNLPPKKYHDITDIDYTYTDDLKPRK